MRETTVVEPGIIAASGATAVGLLLLVGVLGGTLTVLIVWRRRTDRAHAAHAAERGWTLVRPPTVEDLPAVAAAGRAHRPVVRFGAEVDGVRVDLVHLSVASVSGRDDSDLFVAVAEADDSLPGITIEPVGPVERLVSAAGVRRELELGDPWFDRSFELFPHRGQGGIRPDVIRAEVLTPGVQAALKASDGVSLDIGGGRVVARATGDGRVPTAVQQRLDAVAAVAAAVATSLVATADDRVARARSTAGVGPADDRVITVQVDPARRPPPARRMLRSAPTP